MKRICLVGICLFALFTSVGCCYRGGGVDPMTGMAYGGMLQPACAGPLDPLGFWCWLARGGFYAPYNQYGGYPGSFGQMSPYGQGYSPYGQGYSPYSSYPPGAIIEDPCGGCGNFHPTFQGQIQGPVEYGFPPTAPPTERDDAKGQSKTSVDTASSTHFQSNWYEPANNATGLVAH